MTKSGRVALLGVQRPRVKAVPEAFDLQDADDAADLSAGYGLALDDWQQYVLGGWLGRRRNGKWAASTCGVAVPRQNGKNGVLEVRELFGMIMLGEKFLHTAHEVKTARKAFLRLLSFFDNPREYPELAGLVREIRRTNGQEAIYLLNGGSVEFIARSKGSGRGFTVDVLVMDEAQELSDDTLAALLPTISAAPLQNPQTIYTGTPPSIAMNGDVFTRVRATALGGASRYSWHEWSVDGDVNLDDRAHWAATNPALGGRLHVEVIEDERGAFSDEDFARERLGRWLDPLAGSDLAINPAAWAATTDPESTSAEVEAFGIAVSLDRSVSAIGWAGLRADGKAHIEVQHHKRGTGWLVDACTVIAEECVGANFVIDGGGPAASLIEPLENAGLTVIVVGLREIARACAFLVDGIAEKAVFHGPQPELDAAVAGAKWRNASDQRVFGRRVSTSDIAPLEAVTLAAHVLPSVMPLDNVTAAFL